MTRPAVALAVLIFATIATGCATKPDPKRATPKLTAETMMQGMLDGNKSVVRSCVVADGDQRKVADGVMTLTHGMDHASKAVQQRWGKEINQPLGDKLDIALLRPEMINSATENISGETATLAMTIITLSMVQQKDGWRIDLIKSMGVDQQMIEYALPMFSAMGKACNDVAGEIDAGKYATQLAAMTALQERTSAAMQAEVQKIAMKAIRSHFFWP